MVLVKIKTGVFEEDKVLKETFTLEQINANIAFFTAEKVKWEKLKTDVEAL